MSPSAARQASYAAGFLGTMPVAAFLALSGLSVYQLHRVGRDFVPALVIGVAAGGSALLPFAVALARATTGARLRGVVVLVLGLLTGLVWLAFPNLGLNLLVLCAYLPITALGVVLGLASIAQDDAEARALGLLGLAPLLALAGGFAAARLLRAAAPPVGQ